MTSDQAVPVSDGTTTSQTGAKTGDDDALIRAPGFLKATTLPREIGDVLQGLRGAVKTNVAKLAQTNAAPLAASARPSATAGPEQKDDQSTETNWKQDGGGPASDEDNDEGVSDGRGGEGNGAAVQDACALPTFAAAPSETVKLHQRMSVLSLGELTNRVVSSARVRRIQLSFGFIQHYQQSWEFQGTSLGDPVSFISLAPLERRRVHIAQKRKVSSSRSDRVRRSNRNTHDSASSTKASNSATTSSANRNNWSATASGSWGLGGVGPSATVSGTLAGSTESTRQTALSNITEETERSSSEVLSETETTTTVGLQTSFEQIEERIFLNPYADKSVLLTLWQIVLDYQVVSKSTGLTPCLIFDFDPVAGDAPRTQPSMEFNDDFVSVHGQFLRTTLIDPGLTDLLDAQLTLQGEGSGDVSEIAANAIRCLSFLFKHTEVFAKNDQDAFDIDKSFDITEVNSGFSDAVENKVSDVYLVLAGIRFLWIKDRVALTSDRLTRLEFDRRSIEYVVTLTEGLARFSSLSPEVVSYMQDREHFTEQFRRITPFLALAEQLVTTPLKVLGVSIPHSSQTLEEESADGVTATTTTSDALFGGPRVSGQAKIVNHLNCFGRFYTEEFLQFLHEWTGVAAIIELFDSLDDPDHRALIGLMDFQRSFVDETAWVVPFADVLGAQDVVDSFLTEQTDLTQVKEFSSEQHIRMPGDGVHVEATAGRCTLPGLPSNSSRWVPTPTLSVIRNPTDDQQDTAPGPSGTGPAAPSDVLLG